MVDRLVGSAFRQMGGEAAPACHRHAFVDAAILASRASCRLSGCTTNPRPLSVTDLVNNEKGADMISRRPSCFPSGRSGEPADVELSFPDILDAALSAAKGRSARKAIFAF